jgi:hypothetical protein
VWISPSVEVYEDCLCLGRYSESYQTNPYFQSDFQSPTVQSQGLSYPKLLFWLWGTHGTWAADGTHQTNGQQTAHTRPPQNHHCHLSIHHTTAPRLVFQHSRDVCHRSVARRWPHSVANCLPTRCFLWDPNMEIMEHEARTARMVLHNLPDVML